MTYDDIYGIDIDEYCARHGITIAQLIQSIETDIHILTDNYNKYAHDKSLITDKTQPLVLEIKRTIDKKWKHLKRVIEYAG